MTDENKPSPEIASPDQESGEAEHYFALLDAAWETVVHYARVNVDEDIVMFNTAKNAIRALLASRPQPKEPQTEASGELSFQVLRGDLEILMRNGDGQQRGIIQNAIECVDEIEALLSHEAPKDESAKTVPVPIAMLREISERVYGTAEILKCAARYGCTVTESGKEEPK